MLALLSVAACKQELGHKVLFEQGVMKGIAVPSEMKADKTYYKKVMDEECHKGRVCVLHFFYDIDHVSLPFSDEAMSKHSATYNQNPNTGLNRLLLNCELGDFDKSDCFTRE
jgi:hypothetical protein